MKAAAWTRTRGKRYSVGAEYSFRRFGFSLTASKLALSQTLILDAWFLFFGATLWISRKGWNE